jgi:hypothetical protein
VWAQITALVPEERRKGIPDATTPRRQAPAPRTPPAASTGTKRAERARLDKEPSTAEVIRDREESAEPIRVLGELASKAASYGCDVTRPAATARQAVQWLYLGYLAAVKERNGAAVSLGRTLVTRTSFRFLQTLYNLGPAPEPNLTVLRSPRLPDGFGVAGRARRHHTHVRQDPRQCGDMTSSPITRRPTRAASQGALSASTCFTWTKTL